MPSSGCGGRPPTTSCGRDNRNTESAWSDINRRRRRRDGKAPGHPRPLRLKKRHTPPGSSVAPGHDTWAEAPELPTSEWAAETAAFLNILALGERQIEAGRVQPAAEVFVQLRKRLRDRRTLPR